MVKAEQVMLCDCDGKEGSERALGRKGSSQPGQVPLANPIELEQKMYCEQREAEVN
jgi:hypothetical protein